MTVKRIPVATPTLKLMINAVENRPGLGFIFFTANSVVSFNEEPMDLVQVSNRNYRY